MPLTPEEIEKLRENSRIRLDAEGRFWHEDALVEHPLVAKAFHRGLGRAPDGRPTITIGRTWCYIASDGPLYRVRAAICSASPDGTLQDCLLRLDDDTEARLVPASGNVGIDPEGILYARVKDGREWARLWPTAQAELGRWAVTDASGRLGLRTSDGFVALVPVEL